ncbi:PPC domain-containing protein [Phormidium sp. LEGE 05292]|uniref:PPC domain-containing protein n=1 Tax=[Phormidium] sp. LEGE 05292 TaxID=767427 RepID=UPI00187FC80E|nr:PPC domain-containing protein [Phormidium sp. LEGE 05292]MBE9228430.1 PPC domain-containing protein [Phormidium sp. LEGE 05292]
MAVNLFDAKFYAALYPDLAAAGLTTPQQLEAHFRAAGINEGRVASAFFSPTYYGKTYPDLGKAGLTTNGQLFSHLENAGANEGRRSSVTFSPYFYKAVNPDLAAAGFNNEQLYQHFSVYGSSEGRASSEFFNAPFYLATYSDLKAAFGNNYQKALRHFLDNGIQEGRVGSPAVSLSIDPGNVSSSAYDLGDLIAKGTFNGSVGTGDRDDYYRFRVVDPINLNLNLSGLNDTTALKLFADSNNNSQVDSGEEIASVNGNALTPAVINKTLGAGYYYIDVLTENPASNTLYTLAMSPSVIKSTNTVDPGNNQATAFSLGTISGSRTVSDFVGSTDNLDFYSFVLDGNKNLNLSLNGTTDLASAILYRDTNNNGQFDSTEILGSVNSSNNSLGTLTQNLGAGTYFIEVFTNTPTANTSYNMTVAV